MEGRLVLQAGLRLYDLVALDRNWGIRDPARRIAPGSLLSRGQVLDLYPELPSAGLTGAGLFYDGQFYNPPRLALSFLRAAVDVGAVATNYTEAIGFLGGQRRITGVIAVDRLTGDRLEIRGRIVLNTAGPWAAKLLHKTLGMAVPTIFSRDTGFVVRGRRTGDHALACRIGLKDPDALLSRHGRHVFLVPWRDYTLVGVWHRVHTGTPDELEVREDEIRTWLEDVNRAYPALNLRLRDVSMVHAGLTLFEDNSPDAKDLRFGKRSLLIDHREQHGLEGLMTLVGVRATTARGMAERAVDRLLAMLGRTGSSSRTAVTPLPGGRIEFFDDFLRAALREHAPRYGAKVVRSLIHNYGSEYQRVLRYAEQEPGLQTTVASSETLAAQVVLAMREEMAVKLCDVVLRRTELGTGGHPGDDVIRTCAKLMASELGWDATRQRAEIEDVLAAFAPYESRPEDARHA